MLKITAETEPTFYTLPISGLKNLTQLKTRKETLYNVYKRRTEVQFSYINIQGLCQGKRHQVQKQPLSVFLRSPATFSNSLPLLQTSQEETKLFCWYEHQIHPYFKVGPLQVELLSAHPKTEVVLVHKVLSQRLLAFLRNDTGRDYTVCGFMDPKHCLYSTLWIQPNESDNAFRTLQLASRISGLQTTQNPILLAAQAPGGHHGVHTDSVSLQCARSYAQRS